MPPLLPGKNKILKQILTHGQYWSPNRIKFQKMFVSVSCLKFCPEILSLQSKKYSKLFPYKIKAVQEFFRPHWKARRRYFKRFQESVYNIFLNPEFLYFLDEAYFTANGKANRQNKR